MCERMRQNVVKMSLLVNSCLIVNLLNRGKKIAVECAGQALSEMAYNLNGFIYF